MFKSWHLAVIQWVFIHLYGTEFQSAFFPIRKDIFKEEGVGSGSAASGFGNNLWTICAVLKPFGEPSEIPRQMRAKKQCEGGFLTREWLGGMGTRPGDNPNIIAHIAQVFRFPIILPRVLSV